MRKLLLCLCVGGVFGPASAQADPFTYVESVSGDLAGLLPSATLFHFDVGVNTVTGTVHGPGSSPSADFDSIAFTIPTGAELTNISYSFLTTFNADIAEAGSTFAFIGENPPDLDTVSIVGVAPSPALTVGAAFTSALPVPAGIYSVRHTGLFFRSFSGVSASDFSQAYTWSFTVRPAAPVPEPATLFLLGGGLGSIFWRRRQRKERGT